jgi:hypothetical protein
MTHTEFFEQTRAALRALAVPFESRLLLEWTAAMWPLQDQETTPVGWALAFLAEQQPPPAPAAAAAA